jgi:hypothetical protein
MGAEREFNLPGFSLPSDFERFRAKARQFLKANENHIMIFNLRMNEPRSGACCPHWLCRLRHPLVRP